MSRTGPWIFLSFVFGLWLLLFWGVLFGDRQLNYRDDAHFYHPLYKYAQEELSEGRFPLWSPYGNIGQPFFANAALGILYPGKLIFFLPLDYSLLFNIFVTGHVLLACATFYRLARSWRLSTWAATFGALSYGFCGGVFGQYSNPIFLIGAAWAPEAVLWADRALARRSIRSALICGIVLAIMLLGGDPQGAFHVGMVVVLLALLRRRRERILAGHETPTEERPSFFSTAIRHRIVLLGVIAFSVLCLAAIQIFPSVELSKRSNRSGHHGPRTLWEVPGYLTNDKIAEISPVDSLLLRGDRLDAHQRASYNYSTHPVQFATFLWPAFGGRFYPQNTLWLSVFDRIDSSPHWLITFYAGIFPFLLAVGSMRFRLSGRANVRIVWLSWFLLLALWGALGFYGFGWFLTRVSGCSIEQIGIGPPVGGFYWFLQMVVPGYIQFRYPTKLMTLAALPLALLAAFGAERFFRGLLRKDVPSDRFVSRIRYAAFGVAAVSCFLTLAFFSPKEWAALVPKIAPNDYSGPFVPELARAETIRSLLQAVGVLAVLLCLVRFRTKFSKPVLLSAILLCTAIDLYLACKPTLLLTDRRDFRTETTMLAEAMSGDGTESIAPRRFFLHADYSDNIPYPASYLAETDSGRWPKALRWERDHLLHFFYYDLPRTSSGNLPLDQLFEGVTLMPYDYLLRMETNLRDQWKLEQGVASVGGEYILMSAKKPLDPNLAERVELAWREDVPQTDREEFVLWKIKQPRPRVWIERAETGELPPGSLETCRLTHYEPGRVVLEATLTAPGTVVLSDQYWPGWHVDVEALGGGVSLTPGKIRPVQSIFRGVDLPAGSFRLTYRYAPASFRYGAILSVAAWCLATFLLVASKKSRGGGRIKHLTPGMKLRMDRLET